MIKRIVLILSISFLASRLASQDLESCLSEMRIALSIPPDAAQVPQVEQEEVTYQYAFCLSEPLIETRISLFPVSYFSKSDWDANMLNIITGFSLAVMLNIAQDESNFGFTQPLIDGDAEEYGADMGVLLIMKGKTSSFSANYNYVVSYGLMKKESGIVYIFLLLNDLSLISHDSFNRARRCFRFLE